MTCKRKGGNNGTVGWGKKEVPGLNALLAAYGKNGPSYNWGKGRRQMRRKFLNRGRFASGGKSTGAEKGFSHGKYWMARKREKGGRIAGCWRRKVNIAGRGGPVTGGGANEA